MNATPKEIIQSLRYLAEWFDNPNRSPTIYSRFGVPGMILRDLAVEVEKTFSSDKGTAQCRTRTG